jgi:hypothetical protein
VIDLVVADDSVTRVDTTIILQTLIPTRTIPLLRSSVEA